jgi:hypothetical protein
MKDKEIHTYQLKSPYDIISKLPKNASLEELRAMKESNPRQRFWRPLYYHYTNRPYLSISSLLTNISIHVLALFSIKNPTDVGVLIARLLFL